MASGQRLTREALAALREAYVSQLPAKARAIADQVQAAATDAAAAVAGYHLAHRLASSAAMYDLARLSAASRTVENSLTAAADAERAQTDEENTATWALIPDLLARAEESQQPAAPLRVLLVDDDPDVLELLAAHLAAAGLSVTTAQIGEEALQRVVSSEPDVIVSDVRMPGMNGYELCRRVRQTGVPVPFLFLSVLSSPADRLMGFWTGADDYLSKPTDPDDLIEKVRRLGGKRRRLDDLAEQATAAEGGVVLVGSLAELGVPELLQILARLEERVLQVVLENGSAEGTIQVRDHIIVDAELRGLSGKKALFRLLGWTRGSFRVERGERAREGHMEETVERALLEGLAHLDEYRALRASLQLPGDYLRVADQEAFAERRFEEKTTRILDLVDRVHLLDQVIEGSTESDLDALRIVASLLQTGAIVGGRPRENESKGAWANEIDPARR